MQLSTLFNKLLFKFKYKCKREREREIEISKYKFFLRWWLKGLTRSRILSGTTDNPKCRELTTGILRYLTRNLGSIINCLNWTIDWGMMILNRGWRILTDDTWWKRVPDEDWRRHRRVPGDGWKDTDFCQLEASFIGPHLGRNPLYYESRTMRSRVFQELFC